MNLQKFTKFTVLSTICVSSGALVYYGIQNFSKVKELLNSDTTSNNVLEKSTANLSDLNYLEDKKYLLNIAEIDPIFVKSSEMRSLSELLKLSRDSDKIKLLELIGSISSFSDNIPVICKSGCVENLLYDFKRLTINPDLWSDESINSLIHCLKTLSATEKASEIFLKYIDDLLHGCDSSKSTLKYGSLIVLSNLTLLSNGCIVLSNYVDKYMFEWLMDERKECSIKILLHCAHNGSIEKRKILDCKQHKAFPVFIDCLWQMKPNVFILLKLLYEQMKSTDIKIIPNSFGEFLKKEKSSITSLVKMKLLNEQSSNYDVIFNLHQVLDG